jgi:START domain
MQNENAVARPGTWVRNLFKVNENAATKPRTLVRRLVKAVAYASIALITLYVVASAAWRFSGSNQWEFAEERDGVKIYTLKTPGSDLIQVKGVVRLRTTLGGVIKLLYEPATTTDDYGYHELRTIERVDHELEFGSFRLRLPSPFQTREFVVRSQLHQHPLTKEVLIVAAAAPDKAPPNSCCFRVTVMNNTWRFTPLENGQVELEYINNTDFGGYLPALLMNKQRPKFVVGVLSKLQEMVNKRNFQDAKLDFIQEK